MHELIPNLTSAHTVEQRLQVSAHELISASMPLVALIFYTPSSSSLHWYWPLSLSVHASSFAPPLSVSLSLYAPLHASTYSAYTIWSHMQYSGT